MKVEDKVEHVFNPELGVGEVVDELYDDGEGGLVLEIRWSSGPYWWHSWEISSELKPAETPIQRMKRRYSET